MHGCDLVVSSKRLLIAEDSCVFAGVGVLLNVDVQGRDSGVLDRFALLSVFASLRTKAWVTISSLNNLYT